MEFKYTDGKVRPNTEQLVMYEVASAILDEATASSDYTKAANTLAMLSDRHVEPIINRLRDIAKEENQHLGEFLSALLNYADQSNNVNILKGIKEFCDEIPEKGEIMNSVCKVVYERLGD